MSGRPAGQAMARPVSRRALLLAGSSLALAACGGPAEHRQPAEQDSVVVWYEAGLPGAQALPAIIDRYNATQPTVPVLAQPQVDLSVKLLVVIGAHDAPNVVLYPRSRAWPLVSRGAAFPLTDFVRRDGLDGDRFGAGYWEGGLLKDQVWGLPIGADATVLAYNARLLEAANVQPSLFWPTSRFDAACAALAQRNTQGHLVQTGVIWGQAVSFAIWLWQQGADVLSADGRSPAFNGPAGRAALAWLLADQQTNGGSGEIGRLVSITTLTEGVAGVFKHEKLGLLPTTYGEYVRLKAQLSSIPLRLATLPTLDGGQPATLLNTIYAFSPRQGGNPHPEGSWQFMKWLATDLEAQLQLFAAGIMPTSTAALQHPTVTGQPDAQVMGQVLKVARLPRDDAVEVEVEGTLNASVQRVLDGREPAQQALDEAASQATRLIQQEMAVRT